MFDMHDNEIRYDKISRPIFGIGQDWISGGWIIYPTKASHPIERGIQQFYLSSGIILSCTYEIE